MALNLASVGKPIGPLKRTYGWKDLVLYALGVGAGFDELDYVYEDRLKVIPSFSIASIFDFLAETAIAAQVDLSGILHGEQDIFFHNPIPVEGELSTRGRITQIYDKGADKGALVVSEAETFHQNGAKLFTNVFTLFCKKDGGFGGQPGDSQDIEIPDREPDYRQSDAPGPDQPLLYRLSGDIFTLHVDPDFARAAGFAMPIMHGLCTHGYACRAVIRHLMPGQPERMSRFRVRFSRPLYPGTPIETRIWKIRDGLAYFQTVNAQSGEVVLDRGIVEWLTTAQEERRRQLGSIRFEGKVAIVTGAGGGLGREYALELAAAGAKVLVNDLGGAVDGSGNAAGPADRVAAEIQAAGGTALANYDSVSTPEGGQAMVQAALEAFGRVDILINNAGILRDKTLLKTEPETWQSVLDVHLNGAYNVTRPAFAQMRAQGYGRVIFTTSAAGLYGNFGQCNYSAAKLGLVGFMNTLKIEGEPAGVMVNCVAPVAGTRMTQNIIPPELFERLKPEFIAPLVLYLASEQCPVSGLVFNAGAGVFNRAAIATGPSHLVGDGVTPPTVEELAAKMPAIRDLTGWREHPDAMAALTPILDAAAGKPPAAAPDGAGGSRADGGQGGQPSLAGVIEAMANAFRPEAAAGGELVFQFLVTGPQGAAWHADIAGGSCSVARGEHPKPTTSIKMADDDFLALVKGELNPMGAYTSGKLKIGGDLMKSQLVDKLFDFAALAKAALAPGGEEPPDQAPAEQAGGVAGIFQAMSGAFDPAAAAGLDLVFGFEISGPEGGQWHAAIQNGACQVEQGPHPKPTTTIKMAAADFVDLIEGRLNPMTAYTSGKLKIGGDLMKSQLIQKIFKFQGGSK